MDLFELPASTTFRNNCRRSLTITTQSTASGIFGKSGNVQLQVVQGLKVEILVNRQPLDSTRKKTHHDARDDGMIRSNINKVLRCAVKPDSFQKLLYTLFHISKVPREAFPQSHQVFSRNTIPKTRIDCSYPLLDS